MRDGCVIWPYFVACSGWSSRKGVIFAWIATLGRSGGSCVVLRSRGELTDARPQHGPTPQLHCHTFIDGACHTYRHRFCCVIIQGNHATVRHRVHAGPYISSNTMV